jgi:hypothetical protein
MNTTIKYLGFLCFSLLLMGETLQAQAPAAEAQKSFTLKEAVDFALKSNTNYQNALLRWFTSN